MGAKCEKWEAYSRVFRVPFFRFLHFASGLAFTRKVKGFRGLFFRGINDTRNSHEMRKVYNECFVLWCVLRQTLAKCEKCIASLTIYRMFCYSTLSHHWYTRVGKSHTTNLVYCALHVCMLVVSCHGNVLFKLFHYHLQHHCPTM